MNMGRKYSRESDDKTLNEEENTTNSRNSNLLKALNPQKST